MPGLVVAAAPPAMGNDNGNDDHHQNHHHPLLHQNPAHPHSVQWSSYPKIILMALIVIGAATTVGTYLQLSSSSSTMATSSSGNGGNGNVGSKASASLSPSTHDAIHYMNITTASSSTNAIMDQHEINTSISARHDGGSATTTITGSSASKGMHVCTCLSNHHKMNSHLPPLPPIPKRLRWLHIPKTGTSFISTLWAYMTTTEHRYIDLDVNSRWCSKGTTAHYSMYDFALMRRYPWEMYGAPNMIPSSSSSTSSSVSGAAATTTTILDYDNLPLGLVGGTQHQPLAQNLNDKTFTLSLRYQKLQKYWKRYGSEIFEHNFTVATFFRQPEDRIVSAFYDGRHANGFDTELFKQLVAVSRLPATTSIATSKQQQYTCKVDNRTYHNPLECYARFPGIAGCMSRMLTGEMCADGLLQESGLVNLPEAIDIIMNHLDFVGLMEEWNESVCQFHRLYAGKQLVVSDADAAADNQEQQRYWIPPLQGEFSNVHKSTKQQDYGLADLHGFTDVADTVVYEAAKLKFQQMVGEQRCYKYMTWDEIIEIARSRRERKDGDAGKDSYDEYSLPYVKIDDDGNICQPKSCADLGKQCGEWDDGCGRTIICGMCNIARTGLPSTWRVKCVEGQCIDYCPPWDNKGYWFLSDDSPSVMKQITNEIDIQDQTYLTPIDAISICELACNNTKYKSFVSSGLCRCGTSPKILTANLTLEDFSRAHDLNEMCADNKARNSATLTEKETQPICCPHIDEKATPPKGWKRQYVMGSLNLEGEYFDLVRIECGGFQECETVARKKKAELAVFDLFNSMCYLVRNVFDLKSMYTVTKDNQYRYSLDLR